MTSRLDLVRAWLEMPLDDIAGRTAILADDFQNLDSAGNVLMNRDAYIGMYHMLMGAFNDFDFVVSDLVEDGDTVVMTGHFEGMHTGDLDMSAMGLGVVPASGQKIVWPEARERIFVEGGKISKMQALSGGLAEFLEPLGVKLPQA